MNNGKILLLTLVHPDFLPPVYAVAQVLRDLGHPIHILTFDSFVPAELDLGNNIVLESVGPHYKVDTLQRIKLRNQFIKRADKLTKEGPCLIISFCPFSFNCGLIIKNKIPLVYIALEIADFVWPDFLKSPFSFYRNLRTFQKIHKADLLATPSLQRSSWLAGRCKLDFLPYTILNTAYLQDNKEDNSIETFKELVPEEFWNKKLILYTGAVNSQQCTMELVEAFELTNDQNSALIITGIRDNEYSLQITQKVANSKYKDRIKLYPYVTRKQMLALQTNSSIGVYLSKEYYNRIQSKMIAPNKVGEYMAKGLFLLGINNDYLKSFEMLGFAALSKSANPADIANAINFALKAVEDKTYKDRIKHFVANYFCMQKQLTPVIDLINDLKKTN